MPAASKKKQSSTMMVLVLLCVFLPTTPASVPRPPQQPLHLSVLQVQPIIKDAIEEVVLCCGGALTIALSDGLSTLLNSAFQALKDHPIYESRLFVVGILFILQTALIASLLVERSKRLEALRNLADSEERYRNVLETQTELICRYLPDTTLTFVNDAYCKYFGKSREELIGSKFIELIPEHAQQPSQDHINSLIQNPRTVTNEHEVLLADGSVAWQQWTDKVTFRDDGTVELQGVGRDISERKWTEMALRETEERNRAILRAIPDLMFLQTADGTYLDYHAKDPNALLVPLDPFIGKNMKDVLPSNVVTGMSESFTKALTTGETQVSEFGIITEEDRRWFEARVAPCNGGKVLSVVRDITERKKAEEALINSESFNRQIVESSTDCIKILDLEGRLLYMSPNGRRLLEISDFNQFQGTSWIELWTGDNQTSARDAVARARAGGIGSFQGSCVTMLGSPKQWDTLITPIRDGRGNVERLLAISRDVTEQNAALAAIHESEDRFAKAFRGNPQAMSLSTLEEGRYLDVNDSFLEMSGYTRSEVIGRTSAELRIFETLAHRSLLVNPLLTMGVVRNLEMKFRTKNETMKVVLSSAELLEIGGQPCVLIAWSDITERKALEEGLRLSEREFSTLVENSPDIICRLDLNLRYIYVSPSLERLTGAPPERFIGHSQNEVSLPGYDWKGFEASCRKAIETKQTVNRAFDFDEKHYWTRIIPEFARDGSVESLMSISEDVTQRKRTEQELLELTVRLFNIQDEERRRIARELHDGTAQNLFAISINLAKLSELDLQERFEMQQLTTECQLLCEQSLQEIRTLSYLLHPPLLDQAGLVSALQWYVEGFSKRSGIFVDVFAQQIGRLPSEVETALFRIVQEALANVRRHSGSETASIRLERHLGKIRLEIRDRGRGLPGNGTSSTDGILEMGVGIPGMRQRLRQLGGNLEINSNDKGTAVLAVVPLANGKSYGANSTRR